MSKFLNTVRAFRNDEDGAAMVEYTILLGIITATVIAVVIFVGGWVETQWNGLQTELTGEGYSAGSTTP